MGGVMSSRVYASQEILDEQWRRAAAEAKGDAVKFYTTKEVPARKAEGTYLRILTAWQKAKAKAIQEEERSGTDASQKMQSLRALPESPFDIDRIRPMT